MLKSLGRFDSLVIPLLTWVVLLIPFAFYQHYYVSSQQAYLTEHGFRLLAAVGRQLDSYIDSISKTVTSAKKAQAESGKNPEAFLKDYLTNALPDLALEKGDPGLKHIALEFGPHPAVFQRLFDAPVSGRLNLEESVIRERVKGIGEDYFDDVLIVNSKGDVLFQRSTDTRITKLDYLVRTAADGSAPATGTAKQATDSKATPAQPGSPFGMVSESSNVMQIKLAGNDYKLFLQPFLLSSGGIGTEDNDRLVLCGLWRTERLDSASFELPYSSVIWFALFCVAVGSFGWPFLKINYMSHVERLRRTHGWLLVLSMFLGTSAVILMVLNASYSYRVQQNVDADLRKLASQIQSNVDRELPRALDQLTALSKDPEVRLRANHAWAPRYSVLSSLQNLSYPYFDIAFWADGDGKQLVKDTVDPYFTPQTPVNNYAFFRDVIRQISLKDAQPTAPLLARINNRSYSLEPLASPNTGQFHAVIAAPFAENTGSDPEKIKVEVLLTRPLSLVNPVLPPDFGFAVLDREGTVLFHSNPLRNLSEKFILECKDPEALRAALFSESDQLLDVLYSGMERRVFVTKIKHLGPEPETLIVFHNTEINFTINMAIILIGSVLMGVYTLVILLVALIDLMKGAYYPPVSIWPRPECSVRYALVFVVNSLLVLIFLLRYSALWELALLGLTLGILGIAIMCSALLLMMAPLPIRFKGWNEILQPHFKLAYVAAAVSLLIVMTVVPCFGFFKFAHDAASEIAAKHGQLRALNQLLTRRERISSFYRDLKAPQEFATRQISETLDRYDAVELNFLSFSPRPEQPDVAPDGPLQQKFDEWLAGAARWFPANEFGGEMRMLTFASPNAGLIGWTELRENKFRLDWRGDEDHLTVDVKFAEWAGVTRGGWTYLGLLCLLIGGWFFLLMKNIFLPVNQTPEPLDQVDWKTSEDIAGNSLVLGDVCSGRSARLNQIAGINYFDLRVELDRLSTAASDANAVVALDHVDFNMDNRVQNQIRLQVLERLVYRDRCRVVLISSIDPVFYFSEADSSVLAETPEAAVEPLERWIKVMSTFQKVCFEDPGTASFDELINRSDLQKNPLIQWLRQECRHTAYLRALGLEVFRKRQTMEAQPFDRRKALNELAESSDSYYSVLWSTLSAREHLALFQLAKDGWANTKNAAAIRQLLRKGLILCAPMLRIMNDSFRLFVLKSQDQREIADWERQGRQSSWRSLKIVFIATAVGLAAWLFYAQKDLFQVSIGYIVTLGAAITAITNVLSGIRSRSANAAKASGD